MHATRREGGKAPTLNTTSLQHSPNLLDSSGNFGLHFLMEQYLVLIPSAEGGDCIVHLRLVSEEGASADSHVLHIIF